MENRDYEYSGGYQAPTMGTTARPMVDPEALGEVDPTK